MKKTSKDCVVSIRWLNNDIILVYVHVLSIGTVIMTLNIHPSLKYIKLLGILIADILITDITWTPLWVFIHVVPL